MVEDKYAFHGRIMALALRRTIRKLAENQKSVMPAQPLTVSTLNSTVNGLNINLVESDILLVTGWEEM